MILGEVRRPRELPRHLRHVAGYRGDRYTIKALRDVPVSPDGNEAYYLVELKTGLVFRRITKAGLLELSTGQAIARVTKVYRQQVCLTLFIRPEEEILC